MTRVKSGVVTHARHRKVVKAAKGYYGAGSKLYRTAKQAVEKGLLYNYRDRRKRRIEFRALWIARINAAARINGITYSKFISSLIKNDIQLDRKMLSELAIKDPNAFSKIVESVKES